jgi:hypothetical protein
MDSEPEEGELIEEIPNSLKTIQNSQSKKLSDPSIIQSSRSKPFQQFPKKASSPSQAFNHFPSNPSKVQMPTRPTSRPSSKPSLPPSIPFPFPDTKTFSHSTPPETLSLPQKRLKDPPVQSQCKFWENGACNKGNSCTFSHSGPIKVKNELCKYVLTGCCTKGELCGYSHDLSRFPCKYFHGVGVCNAGEDCKFSHVRLGNDEIFNFMKTHEQYLKQVLELTGETNLGEYFKLYLSQKAGK